MTDHDAFQGLIRRVREGDADAAAMLVREYEPEIRRAVRIHLANPELQPILDSMDICQSVLNNFFVRAAAGQFILDRPEHLLGLLVKMARHKLKDVARKQHTQMRDSGRVASGAPELLANVAGNQASPSEIVAGRELLQELRARLSQEERHLAEEWARGRPWDEIAEEVGANPEALRKRLSRAINRVARELGLDAVDHE